MDPFVAEIRIFTGNFAPKGWAFCDGQLLPITQNTALFSLLGTYYGGDGRSNFALPDLRARVPIGGGQGPGLSLNVLGESGGQQQVTLAGADIPSHYHATQVATAEATSNRGAGAYPALGNSYASTDVVASGATTSTAGIPHENRPPYLTLTYIIALQGVYPARS